MKQLKILGVLIIASTLGLSAQGCATAKGAAAGAAIGGLAGDAGKGAQIGATVGFLVDIFD
jgi:hypothetical protein